MKKTLIILFLFICIQNYAQDKYPSIINFDVKNDKNDTVLASTSYHFLMLSPHKAVDLKNYGNEKCEFQILASNANKILLEFNQPSKLISEGRCASGEEKGYIYFELDDKANLIKSKPYIIESCLWSIEIIDTKKEESKKIKYVSENFQTLKTFTTIIDLENVTILRKEKSIKN